MAYTNLEIPIHPCKESDAGIGVLFGTWNEKGFQIRFCWGRFTITFNKKGIEYCNFFATGCGG